MALLSSGIDVVDEPSDDWGGQDQLAVAPIGHGRLHREIEDTVVEKKAGHRISSLHIPQAKRETGAR